MTDLKSKIKFKRDYKLLKESLPLYSDDERRAMVVNMLRDKPTLKDLSPAEILQALTVIQLQDRAKHLEKVRMLLVKYAARSEREETFFLEYPTKLIQCQHNYWYAVARWRRMKRVAPRVIVAAMKERVTYYRKCLHRAWLGLGPWKK